MKRLLICVLVCVFCLTVVHQSVAAASASNDRAETNLSIAVATNFALPMKKIIARFQQEGGGRVSLVSGSSGKLYAQIINGAPYDFFYSADTEKPEQLEQAGLIVPGSRYTYAIGALVLWTAESGRKIDVTVLSEENLQRLAIANPRLAPYGVAAYQFLSRLNLWTSLQTKLVFGENIAQTYQFVETANAKYGLIALSQLSANDASPSGSYWIVPAAYYSPIRQQAVLLARAKNNPAAQAFSRYMQSEAAQQIIQQFGYTLENGGNNHAGPG